MKYILDKLEQTLAATIIAFCLILIFSIAVAVHFYTFRAGATAQIAELEKKIQDLEEAQRNVNGYFSRELSRTQAQLWTLEKLTRGGKSDGRKKDNDGEATILRPADQERKRKGDRGHLAPAKISGST